MSEFKRIRIAKIDAAKSQLIEAIRLLFEERDPVSVHTLAQASLQIIYDHFVPSDVHAKKLMMHYNSVFVKDEFRKQAHAAWMEPKNFFKHADRDLKSGNSSLDFWVESNEYIIFEAVRCLEMIQADEFVNEPEFRVFMAWFVLKYPDFFEEETKRKMSSFSDLDCGDLTVFRMAIELNKTSST
ncbi:MAG: hypothetical protein AAFY56_09275 [Pseudomonadota bacterium]